MAKLSEQTLAIIFNLQRQLIEGIDETTALDSALLTDPYSRLCTLLLRIAEFQPMVPADKTPKIA